MPATKKQPVKKEIITIYIGKMAVQFETVPVADVDKANARIQRKVQPVFNQIKRTRKAAAITASKIILNA
ncbi:hypothetical protein PDL71_01965 [Lacibacter sp. MH-610]|uniref:hypothetical protein n=1 Tax=Lacibacter sp. MH-610 TaxID=3020883 RepID=UPI0038924DD6